METTAKIDEIRTFQTKNGNTRYVVRDDQDREYTTFRERIGEAAQAAKGRRARIEFHEEQRGDYHNVYLDSVTPVAEGEGGDGDDTEPEEAAWRTAVDAAPWLVGSDDDDDVDADEMFEKLKPFKDRVAEDIRDDD